MHYCILFDFMIVNSISIYVSRTCRDIMLCWRKTSSFYNPGCAFLQFRKSGHSN